MEWSHRRWENFNIIAWWVKVYIRLLHCFSIFTFYHQNLEILDNVTTNWKDIIHQIVLWSYPFKDVVRINGSVIEMSGTPMFPSCQSFDISKYWPFESPNIHFTIKFNLMNDLMIWLEIEDRRKALVKR